MTQDNQEDEMLAAMNSAADEMEQGDIDALLGDDDEEVEKTFSSLEQEIIYKSMMNYEKLPMLEVISERMVMAMTTSLKAHTSATADISIKSLEYVAYSDAVGMIAIPSLLSIVHCDPWDGNMLAVIDAKLLYAALEIQLGGRKSQPAKAEGRNFTPIESAIGRKLTEVILRDLSRAFSQITEVDFAVSSVETNPQFATISQPGQPAVHIVLEVALDDRKGRVDLVIPYSTLEPVRGVLSKVFLGEKLGGDDLWQAHIIDEVGSSNVKLRAVLHEDDVPMVDVLSWKVGQTLDLQIPKEKLCTMYANGSPVLAGRIGQNNNKVALRTTDVFSKEEK